MHLVSKVLIPLQKNYCSWSSIQPFAVQITFSSSETLCSFMNSFSLRKKNRSHLEAGQRTWSHVSSSTGCHLKCRLWTTPSPTVFAIRIRIALQMAGWKTKNNILLQRNQSFGQMLDQVHVMFHVIMTSDPMEQHSLVGLWRWTPYATHDDVSELCVASTISILTYD